MKIAILTASYLPLVGGAQVFSYNIARQLAASGNSVDMYVPLENYVLLPEQFRGLVTPLPRHFSRAIRRLSFVGRLWAERYLRHRQRENGYDGWLVIRTYPSGYVASCLKGIVPLILRASGDDIQKSRELDYGIRLNGRIEAKVRKTVKSFDRVIAMTQSARSELLDLGVESEAIVTIPNGVDLDRFEPATQKIEHRATLGWPCDRTIVLTTGRNHPKKGFHLIPSIADKLRSQGLRYQWFVVGQGTDRLKDEIRARGLDEYVITCPQLGVSSTPGQNWEFPDDRLVSMYQAADVYAFPTLLENFPMVIAEAMAAGTAIVATDAPGCGDLIDHQVNGLRAKAGDVEDFASLLATAVRDEELRGKLSRNARVTATAWGWERVAAQYEALFNDLISARPHARSVSGTGT